ncbi:Hypothetical protein POVR1_LOCUS122 [uncultured virus]|nr:Hypothetical protein POVR1_LOCUS122 [uncultured virus]
MSLQSVDIHLPLEIISKILRCHRSLWEASRSVSKAIREASHHEMIRNELLFPITQMEVHNIMKPLTDIWVLHETSGSGSILQIFMGETFMSGLSIELRTDDQQHTQWHFSTFSCPCSDKNAKTYEHDLITTRKVLMSRFDDIKNKPVELIIASTYKNYFQPELVFQAYMHLFCQMLRIGIPITISFATPPARKMIDVIDDIREQMRISDDAEDHLIIQPYKI